MNNYFHYYYCAFFFVLSFKMVHGQINDVSKWKEDIDAICNSKQDLPDQYLEHLCSFLEKVPNDQPILMDFLEHLVTARNYTEAKSDAMELFLKSMISLLEPNGIIFLHSGKIKGTSTKQRYLHSIKSKNVLDTIALTKYFGNSETLLFLSEDQFSRINKTRLYDISKTTLIVCLDLFPTLEALLSDVSMLCHKS